MLNSQQQRIHDSILRSLRKGERQVHEFSGRAG